MSDELRARIRKQHIPVYEDTAFAMMTIACGLPVSAEGCACGQPFPCDAIRALDSLDAAEVKLAAVEMVCAEEPFGHSDGFSQGWNAHKYRLRYAMEHTGEAGKLPGSPPPRPSKPSASHPNTTPPPGNAHASKYADAQTTPTTHAHY